MKKVFITLLAALLVITADAQGLKKVYNETINPIEQIDQAVAKAKSEGKFVNENFEYIHVNYNPRKSGGETQQQQAAALMKRLDNCGRFGFPVFVVLDEEGTVVHIQDSSFLEEGQGYNQEKVLRFFKNWTLKAVKP